RQADHRTGQGKRRARAQRTRARPRPGPAQDRLRDPRGAVRRGRRDAGVGLPPRQERGLTATLTSWRAAICASSTRRGVAYYCGIALGVLAVVVVLRWGSWPAAVVAAAGGALALWLAQIWDLPWTVAGYRARVRRLFDG